MRPERWQRLEEIFHAALACGGPGDERAALVARECAGDEALRSEVESLLSCHERPGGPFARPAFDEGLGVIGRGEARLRAGQMLGPYRVISLVGRGGMGEVYAAFDTRLGRKVALKLLSSYFTEDGARLRRLKHEAQAASALNHPGILTIHEIEEADGVDFIATEFVDGETLRARLARTPPALPQLLDIASQIASALEAAHAAGIVHRDVKPENVMIRPDGYVKILDFGLARQAGDAHAPPPAAEASPAEARAADARGAETRAAGPASAVEGASLTPTDPGVLAGTVAYMSPEQARSAAVDGRSDIWSLGCVLYEMAAGRRPFEAETADGVRAAILADEAEPLSRHAPGVHPELERIVARALRKDAGRRYQCAGELLEDLRRLRRRLEVEAELGAGTNARARASSAGAVAAAGASSVAGRRAGAAAVAAAWLALAAVVVAAAAHFYSGRGRAASIDSLAVLPFVNAGGDPEAEYLCDGLTESVISSLSQLPDLRVMSRNSVFRYKGREGGGGGARAAGRELGVRAVLTGRVVTRGEQLTVSVELIEVGSDRQLWGEQFTRRQSDLLALQEDISREISERLRTRLSGGGAGRPAPLRRYTENAEAYQLYLRGRYFWNKRSAEGFRKGIEYFEQAIERDPSYALAHAGLADCYHLLALYFVLPPQEAYPKAKLAAERAVALDDTLAEAHASLAYVRQNYDWDWAGAERDFRRAITLNPNYATARQWFAWHLMLRGRHEEARREMRRALELDPLSVAINADLGLYFFYTRQYDRAVEQFRRTQEMEPGYRDLHMYLFNTYLEMDKPEEAFAEAERLGRHPWGGRDNGLPLLKSAYAAGGRRGYWRKMLEMELERARRATTPPDAATVSQCYSNLGEADQAFAWLEKARAARSDAMLYLKVNPSYDPVRSDPRFDELLARVNLAP